MGRVPFLSVIFLHFLPVGAYVSIKKGKELAFKNNFSSGFPFFV